MEVTLRLHPTLDEVLGLAPELESYIQAMTEELRDQPPPEGCGEQLLRRVIDVPEGLILTAELPEAGDRVGYCLTGPLIDPLVGDSLPMVLALWVNPTWRRRGLARAMVARVKQELRGRGFAQLAARTGHNDDALISMGERWGFVRSYDVMVYEE